MNSRLRALLRARQSGSAVLIALTFLTVTFLVVGSALLEARNRFRVSGQSGRWAQAAQAAEAGVELTLMSAQHNSWTTDTWPSSSGASPTAWPSAPVPPGASITRTFYLADNVPGTGPISATVTVDQVNTDWLRIRSTGQADIAGGAIAGLDPRDVMLRKLSLRTDRSTGASVGTAPRATRTIEILAKPVGRPLFVRPLLMQQKFTMSGGWVDSFDSGDAAKSTGGLYDVTKRTSNGEVAIMDTEGSSNLGGAPVYGNLLYNGPAPTGTGGVTGTITSPFTEAVQPVPEPAWTTFNAAPTVINDTITLTGGAQDTPALYKVSSLTVSGGKVLTMAPHAVGAESYIEVWVTGSFTTSGSGYILQEPGVHVTYHVAGDVTVSGSSFQNQSNLAANCAINVISVGAAPNQKVTVSGSGTFIGVINAPAADFTASGSAEMSGAIIGRTMNISGGANVHYDEALGRINNGPANGYRVVNWIEAVR